MKKQNLYLLIIAIGLMGFMAYIYNSEDKPKRIKTNSQKFEVEFKREGSLVFISSEGDTIREMDLEIADNEEERTQGLMYRSTMSDKQAMLFVFPVEKMQSFWMKNTYISLDIMFADSENRIVTIQKNTKPYSEDQVLSSRPAIYVIEVVAGFADLYGLKEGDTFTWSRDENI